MSEEKPKNKACERIEGHSILLFTPKYPEIKDKVNFKEWGNHRAYMVKAKGGGGREPVALIEKQTVAKDVNVLKKYAGY